MKFDGSSLKPDNVTFTRNKILSLQITYEAKLWHYHDGTSFPLRNPLFCAVKVTKYANTDNYFYF